MSVIDKAAMRTFALVNGLLVLCACSPEWPRGDWSDYIAKTDKLEFIAGANCDLRSPLDPVTGHFFDVVTAREVRGDPWRYEITYRTAGELRREHFDVVERWTAKRTYAAPYKQYAKNRSCAVLVEIPSIDGARPFYVEDEATKTTQYKAARAAGSIVFWSLAVLAIVVLIPALCPFFADPEGEPCGTAGMVPVALVLVFGNFVVAHFCIDAPWQQYQRALAYARFFDELPRPIWPKSFYFLLAGPAHPKDTTFQVGIYFSVTVAMAVVWVAGMTPFIVRGLFWIVTPLPLAATFERARAQGRTLTAEEVMAAVQRAMLGKSAWQLRVMERKVAIFTRRFGYANPAHENS